MMLRLVLGLILFFACENTPPVQMRGVVPTLHLKQGSWTGIDLSNYFKSEKLSIQVDTVSVFEFRIVNDSLWMQPDNTIQGYHAVNVDINNKPVEIMTLTSFSKNIIFEFHYKGQASVSVMGNFNDWSRTSHPLKLQRGSWQRSEYFTPGRYEYKLVVDGQEILDPANTDSISNGMGGFNSVLMIRDPLRYTRGELIKYNWNKKNSKLEYMINIENFNENQTKFYAFMDNRQLDSSSLNIEGKLLAVRIPHNDNNGLLRIYAQQKDGQSLLENQTILVADQPLHPDIDGDDAHFNVLYSLMVDRFYNGNSENDDPVDDPEVHPLANYHGGDIAGISQKIRSGYFNKLGVNCLWISPIAQGPDTSFAESIPPHRRYTGYHGYWPVNSRKVDHRFGTDSELAEMIQLAHNNNIKVLLDFVSNHTHEDHPYFNENRGWYGQLKLADGSLNIRNWSKETLLTTWFDTFLPSFDYETSNAVMEQVVSDAIYWAREFDFDGFRQDATKHVPHRFWRHLRDKLDTEFPNKSLFQIGETFGSDELILSFVNPRELDSQFNFSIYFAARNELTSGSPNMANLNEVVRENLIAYQPINLMGNITSSHDQVRFMAFADGQIRLDENGTERSFRDLPRKVLNSSSYDRHFMFMAFNMSLPGIPVIYYGEEYGQIGANDPGNRTDMRFEDVWTNIEKSQFNKVKMLVHHRQKYPSLSLGDLSTVYEDRYTLVWLKSYFNEKCLIVFNNSSMPRFISFDLKSEHELYKSLLDRSILKPDNGKVSLNLKPYETRMYVANG